MFLNLYLKFLILKRSKTKIYEHLWQGVAGKIEKRETAWQAAIRELKEELGITFQRESLNHFLQITHKYSDFFLYMHIFLIENIELRLRSFDNEKLVWVSKNNLLDVNILPANKIIINELYQFLK